MFKKNFLLALLFRFLVDKKEFQKTFFDHHLLKCIARAIQISVAHYKTTLLTHIIFTCANNLDSKMSLLNLFYSLLFLEKKNVKEEKEYILIEQDKIDNFAIN